MPQLSQIGNLTHSPLARTLVALLFIFLFVESSFTAILALDVLNADKSARQELQLLNITEEVSNAIYAGKELRSISCRVWLDPSPDKYTDEYSKSHGQVSKRLLDLKKTYARAGLDPALVDPSIRRLEQVHGETLKLLKTTDRNPDYQDEYESNWFQLFRACQQDLRYLHSLFPKRKEQQPLLGLSPMHLLSGFSLSSVFLLALLVIFIDRRISHPIWQLAHDCKRIAESELMPRPERIKDEVGALQESFYEMSVQIAENEKRRRNFLEILQSVQISTLEKVKQGLKPISEMETLAEKARKRCASLSETMLGMVQMLNWMAEALKSTAGEKIIPDFQETSSRQLVDTALTSIESLLNKRQISVASEIQECLFKADPQLLVRVLVNLLSNAIKFSSDGAEIMLKCRMENDRFLFSVKDSGPGIPEQEQNKLFKRFSQLPSPDGQKRRGTGLGLSICKQIVEAHAGEIGCRSSLGQGSEFYFSFPSNPESKAERKEETNSIEAETRTESIKKRDSIKTQFAMMLALFFSIQFCLAFTLFGRFAEASERSRSYASKKGVLLHTQEYLGMFLVWTRLLEQSVKDMNPDSSPGEILGAAMRLLPPLKERIKEADWVVKRLPPESLVRQEMEAIKVRDEKVLKLIQFGVRSGPGLNPALLESIKNKITTALEYTDSRLFQVIAMEREDLDSSYRWSARLRNEILLILLSAAVLDFVLLAAGAFYSLKIIQQLSELKQKALRFADGTELSPSINSKNEIAFLDRSICQVSSTLQEAEARRQSILAVISHDLATPLSSLVTGIDLLSRGLFQVLPETQLAFLHGSEKNLNRLLRQIYDLLLIEKVDAGMLPVKPEKFPIQKALEAALAKLTGDLEEKNIDLEINCGESVYVDADEQQTERILEALLRNAIEASAENGKITVSTRSENRETYITVKDQAAGIPAQLQTQIFERFRFLDGKPVTGLGLPLAYKLARAQHGDLKIGSTGATGTEICLKLPAEAKQEPSGNALN